MTRSHALWVWDNWNRAFWSEPLLPEPEEGFESAPRPAGHEGVKRWFAEAANGGTRPRRRLAAPADEQIDRIAWLVNEFSNLSCPPPETQVGIERGHRLQRAVVELKDALGEYLNMAQLPPHGPKDFRLISTGLAQTRLVDLWNALVLAEPYIGPPSKQGRQLQPWHVIARALYDPIASALAGAGRPKASHKSDGPMVKIIREALKAVTGIDREPEAIASCLKRRP
jgi:hypothetical protein